MARIIHTADMHLDSRFTSGLPPEKAKLRREDQREVFGKIVDMAKNDADVLLIAGDLFDGAGISGETIEFLKRKFGELGNIPVFIAPGNHDPYTSNGVYAKTDFGANVHIFEPCGGYFDIDELQLRISGIGFASEDGSDMPPVSSLKPHPDHANILLLHADMNGTDPRYNIITEDDISGFDYAALGHIHHPSLAENRGYPGIPEPRGFDELSGGGVIVGSVERGKTELKNIPVAKRRYHEIGIRLDTDILDGRAAAEKILAQMHSADDIYRITLKGRTGRGYKPDTELLTASIAEKAFSIDITDKTKREYDLKISDGDNGLRAEFIRRMLAEIKSPSRSESERELYTRALYIGLDALEGGDADD